MCKKFRKIFSCNPIQYVIKKNNVILISIIILLLQSSVIYRADYFSVLTPEQDFFGHTEYFRVKIAGTSSQFQAIESCCIGFNDTCAIFYEKSQLGSFIHEIENINSLLLYFEEIKKWVDYSVCENPINFNEKIIILFCNIPNYAFSEKEIVNGYNDYALNNRRMIIINLALSRDNIIKNGTYLTKDSKLIILREYLNIIQREIDSDEDLWMVEGLSDFFVYIYTNYIPPYIEYYYAFHSTNMHAWDTYDVSILENYGSSFLFLLYLYENNDIYFLKDLFIDEKNGFYSLVSLLGSDEIFQDIFVDWSISNCINRYDLLSDTTAYHLGYYNGDISLLLSTKINVFSYMWDYGPFSYICDDSSCYGIYSKEHDSWTDNQLGMDANYFYYELNSNYKSLLNFIFHDEDNFNNNRIHMRLILIECSDSISNIKNIHKYKILEDTSYKININNNTSYVILIPIVLEMHGTYRYYHSMDYCIKLDYSNNGIFQLKGVYFSLLNDFIQLYSKIISSVTVDMENIELLNNIEGYVMDSSEGINYIYKIYNIQKSMEYLEQLTDSLKR